MGTLYLVATPIGNLEDITLRALRILREAGLIAAEDTRVARKLLDHYEISTPVVSYHEHSPPSRLVEIADALATGDVAVISDAGMPGISDPGSELVRQAVARGHPVVPIPGPSSVTAAAAASGLADRGYVFTGFLPRKAAGRMQCLQKLSRAGLPIIVFEAPSRVVSLVSLLAEMFPDSDLVIGREVTKLYEEWLRGKPSELINGITERGEFTLVILPNVKPDEPGMDDLDRELRMVLADNASLRDAVEQVVAMTGLPRRTVYRRALELQVLESPENR